MRRAARALVAAVVLLAGCSGTPPQVERITIVNPTDYDVDVEVSDEERDGWLPLKVVEARSEGVAHEVIDQGQVWVFRFRHWGEPVGENSIPRGQLERSGWRVEVPPEVEERIRELGRPPSD